jgi:hypothetical protein
MKKSILVVAAIFSIAVMFTSCKETKKEEAKEEVKEEMHKDHDQDKEAEMAHDAYQCPMDCEKGKTYEKEGSCPVCKMDLKAQKADTDHAAGCKCLEGGECKCEEGKCQCKAETASAEMQCEKCEPGKCTCDGKEVVQKEMDCTKCEPGSCECKA